MEEDYCRNILSSPFQSNLSSLYCQSQPFCLFRNHSKYVYQSQTHSFQTSFRSKWLKNRRVDLKNAAINQARYYTEYIKDKYVPFGLLENTLELELKDNFQSSNKHEKLETVTSFSNADDSYLIYCSGKNMDELSIRNGSFLLPQYCYPCQPAFTMNIGKGATIRQVTIAGKTSFGTNVNILARTMYEIFYLQAVQLDEFLDEYSIPSTCILETKTTHMLPEQIVDFCGSSSDWSHAAVLTKSGKLFTWNPIQGIKPHSEAPLFRNENEPPYFLSNSLHPSVLYNTTSHSVYSCDLRSRPETNSLIFSSSSAVTALSGQSQHPYRYFISTDNHLLSMDSRYTKLPIHKQYVGEDQEKIHDYVVNSFADERNNCRSLDLVLSGSKFGPNIQLHYTNDQEYSLHDKNHLPSFRDPFKTTSRKMNLSSTLSPFQANDFASWKRETISNLDTLEGCIGLNLLILENRHGFQNNFEEKDNFTKNKSKTVDGKDNLYQDQEKDDDCDYRYRPNHFALVIQQSGIGDVYAQQIAWSKTAYSRPLWKKKRDKSPSKSYLNIFKAASSSVSSVGSQTSTENQETEEDSDMKTVDSGKDSQVEIKLPSTAMTTIRRNPFSLEDEIDSDDDDEIIPSSLRLAKPLPLPSKPKMPQKKSSSEKRGRRRLILPPIHSHLPIGTRFYSSLSTLQTAKEMILQLSPQALQKLSPTQLQSFFLSTIYQTFQKVKKYLKSIEELKQNQPFLFLIEASHETNKRSKRKKKQLFEQAENSILFGLQLTLESFHNDDILKNNVYPLSSFAFLDYLPKEDLLPYDKLQFHVLDIRRDFPLLPEQPHLFYMKTPLYKPIEKNENNIIYELILKYEKELIDYFTWKSSKKKMKMKIHEYHCFTLYEIWKKLFELSQYRIKITVLRSCLLRYHHYQVVSASSLFFPAASSSVSSGPFSLTQSQSPAAAPTSRAPSIQFLETILPSRFDLPTSHQNSLYSDGFRVERNLDVDDDDGVQDGDDDEKDEKGGSIVDSLENDEYEEEFASSEEEEHNGPARKKKRVEPASEFEDTNEDTEEDEEVADQEKPNLESSTPPVSAGDSLDEKYYFCPHHTNQPPLSTREQLESWDCCKRDCLVPHRLLFTIKLLTASKNQSDPTMTTASKPTPATAKKATTSLLRASIFGSQEESQQSQQDGRGGNRTPSTSRRQLFSPENDDEDDSSEDEEIDNSGFPKIRNRTDVTSDLIDLLSEQWDHSMKYALPKWSKESAIDIFR